MLDFSRLIRRRAVAEKQTTAPLPLADSNLVQLHCCQIYSIEASNCRNLLTGKLPVTAKHLTVGHFFQGHVTGGWSQVG